MRHLHSKRKELWNLYYNGFKKLQSSLNIKLPEVPAYATNNAHVFYLVFNEATGRSNFINVLKENNIHAVFHYLSLHNSEYYQAKHDGRVLINSDKFTECLVRLPLFYELNTSNVLKILEVASKN